MPGRDNPYDLVVVWDENKDCLNRRDHGIGFDEAATVFNDSLSITVPDDPHSLGEARFNIIGTSIFNQLLVVAYTERRGKIRLISARTPTKRERRQYEEGD